MVLKFACAALLALSLQTQTASAEYPDRPVTIVVNAAAGGSQDVSARMLAEALSEKLGQPFVVENRGGAAGVIGATYVKEAKPDGYTLLFGTGSTQVITPAMEKDVPYDTFKDFTPISQITKASFAMLLGPSTDAKTIEDVVRIAKEKNGAMTFGAPSSTYELTGRLLERKAGIKFTFVPYKGFAPTLLDLSAGRIDVTVAVPTEAVRNTQNVRMIAMLGTETHPQLPDLPTSASQGYPDILVPSWSGLFGPAGLPQEIKDKLETACREALAEPGLRKKMEEGSFEPVGSTAAELDAAMHVQLEGLKPLLAE